MTEIFICIPGDPVGKGRARVAMRGKSPALYTPDTTVRYEAQVSSEARYSMDGRPLITGPVALKLELYFGIPQSYTKKRTAEALEGRLAPTKKPDIDNVVKAICDAFNGSVWNDDVQVVDLHVIKRFAKEPCVKAWVKPLDMLAL